MGIYIIASIVALTIQITLSVKFADCAEEKGYSRTSHFWLCFFLGIVGYCLVAALPDQNIRYKLDKIISNQRTNILVTQQNSEMNSNSANSQIINVVSGSAVKVEKWQCVKCGTVNSMNYGQCKKCGSFRK